MHVEHVRRGARSAASRMTTARTTTSRPTSFAASGRAPMWWACN